MLRRRAVHERPLRRVLELRAGVAYANGLPCCDGSTCTNGSCPRNCQLPGSGCSATLRAAPGISATAKARASPRIRSACLTVGCAALRIPVAQANPAATVSADRCAWAQVAIATPIILVPGRRRHLHGREMRPVMHRYRIRLWSDSLLQWRHVLERPLPCPGAQRTGRGLRHVQGLQWLARLHRRRLSRDHWLPD